MIELFKKYFILVSLWISLACLVLFIYLDYLYINKMSMTDFLSRATIYTIILIAYIVGYPINKINGEYHCLTIFGWKKLDLRNITVIFRTRRTILIKIDNYNILQYRIVGKALFYEDVLNEFEKDVKAGTGAWHQLN